MIASRRRDVVSTNVPASAVSAAADAVAMALAVNRKGVRHSASSARAATSTLRVMLSG